VVLFGWYSFGLFQQADTPAAANPFTGLEQFLEANNLSYGLGGYWDSSVITVDTGGAVTIRAVSPSCMQPYQWESKPEWYEPTKNVANFVLLSNQSGYFTSFSVRGSALTYLNNRIHKRDTLDYGSVVLVKGTPQFDYNIRTYQGNLLSHMRGLYDKLQGKPENQSEPANPTSNPIVQC
jgi:hypothetical protein